VSYAFSIQNGLKQEHSSSPLSFSLPLEHTICNANGGE